MSDEKVVLNAEEKTKPTPKVGKSKTIVETPVKRETRSQIAINEMIRVRSVVEGRLTYISPKTNMTIIWAEFGAEEYVEFGELLTMKASRARFLTEPWLVVEDEEVAKHLGLSDIYERMINIDEIESFFRLNPKEMEDRIRTIPNGTKTLLADRSRKLIQDGSLYDMRIIKILEKELMVDLQILMD